MQRNPRRGGTADPSMPSCSMRHAPRRASCAAIRTCAGCAALRTSRNWRKCRLGCSRRCGRSFAPAEGWCIAPAPSSTPKGDNRSKRFLRTTKRHFRSPPPVICCPIPGKRGWASGTIPRVTTTDSSTPCWRSAPLRSLLERGLALALALVLSTFACAGAFAADTAEIAQLRLERTEDGVVLSTTVIFALPPVIEDALAKGIPMYFVAEATLLRDRWYWYDKPVAQTARHMRLSYQPLTRRWRLVMSPSQISSSGLSLGQTFDSRDEALAAIQRLSHWKI